MRARTIAVLWLLAAVCLGSTAVSAATGGDSALSVLESSRPGISETLDLVTRAVLSRISPSQLEQLRSGAPTSSIVLSDGTSLDRFLLETFGEATYLVPWSTIDGGGGASTGGTFTVTGTIGQPDAGSHADGTAATVILGGYWGPRLGAASQFFGDGFETGDLSRWTATQGGVP